MEKRLWAAALFIGFGLVLVAGRLVQLTVIQHRELADRAASQHHKRISWTSQRGTIVDRNGTPLALSVAAESLFVHPGQLPDRIDERLPALAAALQLPAPRVAQLLKKPAPFVWLRRQASPHLAAQVRSLAIAGIGSHQSERRVYPQGSLAAPLLGFTDIDAKGLAGVEQAYDHYLRGRPVELTGLRDAFGRMIFAYGLENGQSQTFEVRLSLDAGLQYIAEQELARAVEAHAAKAGTVVILDPRSFAVLAMAQVPSFDPHTPATTSSANRRNRLVSEVYEPGSTLKALLAAAALDSRLVRSEEQIFCEQGRYRIDRRTIHDYRPRGWLSFAEVIKYSSNIGVAKVAQRLGQQTYFRYLRAFGLGQTSGIDLPAESPGLLPAAGKWPAITLATTGFGYGVAVTPLQLAAAFATLANDGVLMRPYVVQDIRDSDGTVLRTNRSHYVWQAVRPETAKQVVGLLESAVEDDGTGWQAQLEGFRVAGKTGTTQKLDDRGRYSAQAHIASFVGIVPVAAPRLVIAVTIDEPRRDGYYGGQVAAPVFRAIAGQALASLGVEATTVPVRANGPTQPGLPGSLDKAGRPNFLGLSLREALRIADRHGWRVSATGSGYVVGQAVQHDPHTAQPFYRLSLAPPRPAIIAEEGTL